MQEVLKLSFPNDKHVRMSEEEYIKVDEEKLKQEKENENDSKYLKELLCQLTNRVVEKE